MSYTYIFPNIISLGGIELTDDSRGPLIEQRDPRENRVDLASGKIKKFIKGVRRKWTVTWTTMPLDVNGTIDGYAGRNELRALVMQNGPFSLIVHDGKNVSETYSVWIDDFTDEIDMRRSDTFFFNVTLTLLEVG